MDDQVLLNKYYYTHKEDIYIDINAELFLTIGSPLTDLAKFVNIKNNTIYYKQNKPFLIHAAGCGYLDTILKELNYTLKNDIAKEIKNDFTKKTFNNLKKNSLIFIDINKYNILFFIIITLYLLQMRAMWDFI